MSTKSNLPNIPIYIGDWERDCNVLSLESEAAWMRIIFKLWSKGKQSTYKIPTKSLQNLWRCSESKMLEILDELIFNEIAEISMNERFIEFTCRRFKKENDLSKKRSEAVSKRKDRKEKNTKPLQNYNKRLQNTEIEIENENENESVIENKKGGVGEKTNREYFLTIEELKKQTPNEFSWRETIIRNYREAISNFGEEEFFGYLNQFFKQIENDGEQEKTLPEFKKHFSRWLNIQIKKDNENKSNNPTRKIGRKTEDDIREDLEGWGPE